VLRLIKTVLHAQFRRVPVGEGGHIAGVVEGLDVEVLTLKRGGISDRCRGRRRRERSTVSGSGEVPRVGRTGLLRPSEAAKSPGISLALIHARIKDADWRADLLFRKGTPICACVFLKYEATEDSHGQRNIAVAVGNSDSDHHSGFALLALSAVAVDPAPNAPGCATAVTNPAAESTSRWSWPRRRKLQPSAGTAGNRSIRPPQCAVSLSYAASCSAS
jgi:hypothetical protein